MPRAAGGPAGDVRRLGLFGGTFDPPHLGHLMVAERARDRLRLERVVFVPSGAPPHKRRRGISPGAVRLAMTRLAVRGNPGFEVSNLETRRRGASYTVDTVRALRAAHPRARLFLVLGEDSLAEFPTWHDPEAILALATLAVAPRPGASAGRPAGRARPRKARVPGAIWLDGPGIDLSSSEVRALARAGRSLRYLVPEPVAAYIERRRPYGTGRGARRSRR